MSSRESLADAFAAVPPVLASSSSSFSSSSLAVLLAASLVDNVLFVGLTAVSSSGICWGTKLSSSAALLFESELEARVVADEALPLAAAFKELFAAALAAVLLGLVFEGALTVLLSLALTDVLECSVLATTSLPAVAFLDVSAVVLATELLDATSALGATVLATTTLLAVEFLEASAVVLATDLLDAMSVLGAAVLATASLPAVAFWEASVVVLAVVLSNAVSFERPLAVLLAVPLEAAAPDGVLAVLLAAVLAALVLPTSLPAVLLPSPEVELPS